MAAKEKNKKRKLKTSLEASKQPYNERLIYFLLAGLAIILYLNTLGHQFAFDDSIVITENAFTKKGFGGIYELITRDFFEGIYGEQGMDLTGGRYRPLSLVMFAIEYQFFPNSPWIGHFLNILFYALTGVLMYHVLKKWMVKSEHGKLMAFLCTLLFIIHPIHTEVVANIKSRDEIMALFLLLGSFYFIHKHLDTNKKSNLLAALICFFLSMSSKENAFTYVLIFPAALMVLKKYEFKKAAIYGIPFLITGLGYILLRYLMLQKDIQPGLLIGENPDIMENPFYGASLIQKLATIGWIMMEYFKLLIFPHPLSCDYSFNQIPWVDFSEPMAILGWAISLGLLVYSAVMIWKKNILALCVLMFFAPLSLVLNLFFNIGAPMADRFLYLPSFGFCLAMALLLTRWLKSDESNQKVIPKLGLLLTASIVLLSSFKVYDRNKDWYDNDQLFAADIHAVPNSAKIHYYHANSLLKKFLDKEETVIRQPGAKEMLLLDSAAVHFLRSYEINPKFHHSTYNLGLVNVHKKNTTSALKWLNYTLELQPNHGMTHELLVRVYGEMLQQPDKALEHLNVVLSTVQGQQNPSNYLHYAIIMAMKGNIESAESAFLKAAQMDSGLYQNCYQNLFGMFSNAAQQANLNGDQLNAQNYAQKAKAYKQMLN